MMAHQVEENYFTLEPQAKLVLFSSTRKAAQSRHLAKRIGTSPALPLDVAMVELQDILTKEIVWTLDHPHLGKRALASVVLGAWSK